MSQRGGTGSAQRGGTRGRGGSKHKNEKTNKNTNKKPRENQAPRGSSQPKNQNKTSQRGKGRNRGGQQYQGESRPIERRTAVRVHPLSGQQEHVPLLDKSHAITSDFLCFLPSDNNMNHADTLDALTLLNRDAKSLLRQSFHEFWSTVTYNASFPFFVNTFLCHWKSPNVLAGRAARNDELYFMGNNRVPEMRPEEKQRRELFLNMWKILHRLTNIREGEDWMSEPHYAHLMRHGKVFTVASLIDICSTYGLYQSKQVSKMIRLLLRAQPDYEVDFGVAFNQTQTTLQQLIQNVASSASTPDKFSSDAMQEMITFLYSITTSLLLFLVHAPDETAVQIVSEHMQLIVSFVVLFEAVIPFLQKLKPSSDAEEKLEVVRSALFSLVRHLTDRAFVMPLTKVQRMEDYNNEQFSTMFLWFVNSLVDMTEKNPLRESLPCPPREEMLLTYLQSSLQFPTVLDTFSTHFPAIPEADIQQVKEAIQPFTKTAKSSSSSVSFGVERMGEVENEYSVPSTLSQQRLDNIAAVKSILDYLGDGFINECLELYNDNVEVVCDRILSESLAEPLLELDRNMSLPSASPSSSANHQTRAFNPEPVSEPLMKILSRKNVSDDDDDDDDFKEVNKRFYQNVYDDEYDDSMDQYVRFGVDDGETEDERVSLTESGEFEQKQTDDGEAPTKPARPQAPRSKFAKTKNFQKRRGDNKPRNH